MTEDDRYTRITLRIPKELHAQLQIASEESSKSINAEIIERVRQSFSGDADHSRQILNRISVIEALLKKKIK